MCEKRIEPLLGELSGGVKIITLGAAVPTGIGYTVFHSHEMHRIKNYVV